MHFDRNFFSKGVANAVPSPDEAKRSIYLMVAAVMLAAALILFAAAGMLGGSESEATGLSDVLTRRLATIAVLGGMFLLALNQCVRTNGASGIGAALIALTALAVQIRAPGLNIGLWRDESSTYFNSHWDTMDDLFGIMLETELNPPLYFLFMGGWVDLFGSGELALKMPSFIAGVLLTPAVFFLGRAADSWRVGLFAAFLITITPPAIYYAQEARPYTWPALVACLVLTAFLGAVHGRRPWIAAAAVAVLGAVACYSHYAGLILMGALGGAAVVLAIIARDVRRFTPALVGVASAFVMFTPWLPIFSIHLDAGAPWTEIAPLLMRPIIFLRNLAFLFPWPMHRIVSGLACGLVVAYAFLLIAHRLRTGNLAQVRALEIRMILVAAVLGPAAGFAYLSLQGRYMFPFAPGACVLLALFCRDALDVVSKKVDRRLTSLLAVSLLAWTMFGASAPMRVDEADKSGIRALAATITHEDAESTLYVLAPDFVGPTFGYYTRGLDVAFFGFARFDGPEIFRPLDYAEIWARSDALDEAERRIHAARRDGRVTLALIQSNCGATEADRGSMPYSRAKSLADRIAENFQEQAVRNFFGSMECIKMTSYAIGSETLAATP